MNALLIGTVVLVMATKALDCVTTLRAIRTAAAETNPIARWLMQRLGLRRAIAFVFAASAACACTLAGVAWMTESVAVQSLFVVVGLFVATVQAAVAHTNWTGRWNAITSRVLRCHQEIATWASRR